MAPFSADIQQLHFPIMIQYLQMINDLLINSILIMSYSNRYSNYWYSWTCKYTIIQLHDRLLFHTPSQSKEKQSVVKPVVEDNNQHQVEYHSFTKHPTKCWCEEIVKQNSHKNTAPLHGIVYLRNWYSVCNMYPIIFGSIHTSYKYKISQQKCDTQIQMNKHMSSFYIVPKWSINIIFHYEYIVTSYLYMKTLNITTAIKRQTIDNEHPT